MKSKKGRINVDKVMFREKEHEQGNTNVVRISTDNHSKIMDISDKCGKPASSVANKLLSFALKNVEWEK